MKKFITYLIVTVAVIVLLNSCATTKRAFEKGNYYTAIQRAITHLHKHPSHAYQVDYLVIAHAKHKQQVLQTIHLLEAENNAANAEQIWQQYAKLQSIQNSILVLMPLQGTKGNAVFEWQDYTAAIISNKNSTIAYLYNNAQQLLTKTDRFSAREAIVYLNKIKAIQTNYLQVNDMLIAANRNAKTFVQVQTIPSGNLAKTNISFAILENIATNKLQNGYADYYTTTPSIQPPHYVVNYNIANYQESPNKETEKSFIQTSNKVVSVTQKKDINGKPLLDKKGNIIMDTVFEKIQCTVLHTTKSKSMQYVLQIKLQDAATGRVLSNIECPIKENFEHNYATYKGDANALTDEQKSWINNKKNDFPTNHTMTEALIAKSVNSIEDWLMLDANKRLMQ